MADYAAVVMTHRQILIYEKQKKQHSALHFNPNRSNLTHFSRVVVTFSIYEHHQTVSLQMQLMDGKRKKKRDRQQHMTDRQKGARQQRMTWLRHMQWNGSVDRGQRQMGLSMYCKTSGKHSGVITAFCPDFLFPVTGH